jgi:hypothetical protein
MKLFSGRHLPQLGADQLDGVSLMGSTNFSDLCGQATVLSLNVGQIFKGVAGDAD